MMDFRLKVFIAVAQQLSFTKASKELFVSQPAISKHIQELESMYEVQLFNRKKNKIQLTKAGERFLEHAKEIVNGYNSLQLEMNLFSGKNNGELRIGASSTIAQYLLPVIIARHITAFPGIKLSVLSGNSEQIEQALEEHKIDIGLVEGSSRKHELKYVLFARDELVLVTHFDNPIKEEITKEELLKLPMILRENGSGTLDVIEKTLVHHHLRLSQMNIVMQLGSTESIKSLLLSLPSAFAIVSISALSKELSGQCLKVIETDEIEFLREFAFVLPSGYRNPVAEKFMIFARQHHNHQL